MANIKMILSGSWHKEEENTKMAMAPHLNC